MKACFATVMLAATVSTGLSAALVAGARATTHRYTFLTCGHYLYRTDSRTGRASVCCGNRWHVVR